MSQLHPETEAGLPPKSNRPLTWNGPLFDSPLLDVEQPVVDLSAERSDLLRRFREDGYLRLDGWLDSAEFPETQPSGGLVQRIVASYPWLFDPTTEFDASPRIISHLELDKNRRQDAWAVVPAVRELACLEPILDLLRDLYGREPIPFQTLNFLRGTQQSLHSDGFHFSSIPRGFLCGVWVALQDVTEDNGPLMYVPGSQRWPWVELSDLRRWAAHDGTVLGPNYNVYEAYVREVVRRSARPVERLTCPKGTVLIWSGNLLHGGAPILNPKSTRMSQVTHYYFEDCLFYAPVHSDAAIGEFELRDVYDIRSEQLVPHRLSGEALERIDVGYEGCELFRLRRAGRDRKEDAADPILKLQARIAQLSDDRDRLAIERGNLAVDVQGFQAERSRNLGHAEGLLAELERIRSRPSYRILGAIKRAIGRGAKPQH